MGDGSAPGAHRWRTYGAPLDAPSSIFGAPLAQLSRMFGGWMRTSGASLEYSSAPLAHLRIFGRRVGAPCRYIIILIQHGFDTGGDGADASRIGDTVERNAPARFQYATTCRHRREQCPECFPTAGARRPFPQRVVSVVRSAAACPIRQLIEFLKIGSCTTSAINLVYPTE